MAVYVDELFVRVSKDRRARFVGARTGHKWCHMLADTEQELHAMAEKLGLERRWFQEKGPRPHYDLTPNKRNKALALGAKAMPLKQILLQLLLKERAERQSKCEKLETKTRPEPTSVPSSGAKVLR